MTVTIKRVTAGNDHDDTKWLVLEGSIDGIPAVTKRRTLNTAALASGDLVLADEIATLRADVEEYAARLIAVEAAVAQL